MGLRFSGKVSSFPPFFLFFFFERETELGGDAYGFLLALNVRVLTRGERKSKAERRVCLPRQGSKQRRGESPALKCLTQKSSYICHLPLSHLFPEYL